jgi:hypothetical protein
MMSHYIVHRADITQWKKFKHINHSQVPSRVEDILRSYPSTWVTDATVITAGVWPADGLLF